MAKEETSEFAEQLAQLESEQYHDGEAYRLDAEGNMLKGAAMDAEGGDDVKPEADEGVNENEPAEDVEDDPERKGEEDEDDEDDEDDEEGEEGDGEVDGKKLSKSAQLTRALREARRTSSELKREVAELRRERQAEAAQRAAPRNADGTVMTARDYAMQQLETDEKAPKKPDPLARDKDGKLVFPLGRFDETYDDVLNDYRDARKDFIDAKIAEFQKGSQSAPASAAPEQALAELVKTVEAFKADDKGVQGFKEAVKSADADEFPLSEVAVRLGVESPVGREMLVHLHQNPKLAQEIAALPDYQQAARIGKLEATILAEAEAKKKAALRPSSAPKPLGKIRGSGASAPPNFDSEDFEAVERKYNAQQARSAAQHR